MSLALSILLCGTHAFVAADPQQPTGIQRFNAVKTWRLRVQWGANTQVQQVLDTPERVAIETTTINGTLAGRVDFRLVKARDTNGSFYQWETLESEKPTGSISFHAVKHTLEHNKESGEEGWSKLIMDAAGVGEGGARMTIDVAQGRFQLGGHASTLGGRVEMSNSLGGNSKSESGLALSTGGTDWEDAVPAQGLVIEGKARQLPNPAQVILGARPMDVSWTLTPWEEEPGEAKFAFANKDWLPDPDAPCDIQISWKGKAEKVKVTLANISHEPGTCLNSAEKGDEDDLLIESQGKWLVVHEGSGKESVYTASLVLPKDAPKSTRISLKATDRGAYAKLKVQVSLDGAWKDAKETTTGHTSVNVPYDIDDNHIADKWEDDNDAKGLPADWDGVEIPGQTAKGDGLTLYQKYRGLMVLEGGGKVFKRLKPKEKVHFVIDPNNLFDLDRWYRTSGIRAYKLSQDMADGDRRVDFNVGDSQSGGKYACRIRKIDGDAGDPTSTQYAATHTTAPGEWSPKKVDYSYIYSDRIGAMIDRIVEKMKRALNNPTTDDDRAEAQVLEQLSQSSGMPLAEIKKAVTNFDAAARADRVDRMVALSAIHEMGHACGIEGHLMANTDKEDDENIRNPACPMQYLDKVTRRRFVLFGELSGDGPFCKGQDNCWKNLNVKN